MPNSCPNFSLIFFVLRFFRRPHPQLVMDPYKTKLALVTIFFPHRRHSNSHRYVVPCFYPVFRIALRWPNVRPSISNFFPMLISHLFIIIPFLNRSPLVSLSSLCRSRNHRTPQETLFSLLSDRRERLCTLYYPVRSQTIPGSFPAAKS